MLFFKSISIKIHKKQGMFFSTVRAVFTSFTGKNLVSTTVLTTTGFGQPKPQPCVLQCNIIDLGVPVCLTVKYGGLTGCRIA